MLYSTVDTYSASSRGRLLVNSRPALLIHGHARRRSPQWLVFSGFAGIDAPRAVCTVDASAADQFFLENICILQYFQLPAGSAG